MSKLQFDSDHCWLSPEEGCPPAPEGAYEEWLAVYNIITTYVQPDSVLSLDDATEQMLAAVSSARSTRELPIHDACKSVCEQIPYDDPAQAKLMALFENLGTSPAILEKFGSDFAQAKSPFHSQLGAVLDSGGFTPDGRREDGEDPMFYVNTCAFVAQLMTRSLVSEPDHVWALRYMENAMSDAFATDSFAHKQAETTRECDAWVMGATQYIHWRVGLIFDFVRKDDGPVPHTVKKSPWSRLKNRFCWSHMDSDKEWEDMVRESQRRDEVGPEYTWRQWQDWQNVFRKAVENNTYSETCRRLADEAVTLMVLQEKMYAESKHTEHSTLAHIENNI